MFVRSSFVGCPAPVAAEVVSVAQSFGVGVAAIRPSGRSFSGWVCVCSFGSEAAALRFAAAVGVELFGAADTYFAVRSVGRRWRVSVPCLSPAVVVRVWRGRPRLGRFRLVVGG
ncbi:hypothetical protein [Fischerella sp. PCC 9605]|uniref:hypothetical protein n=1 Tax=Fischerella sp. PCC 9605 TaxID=1173024 RepID=UPI0012DDD299|nr:hypothetical protein [Fischerella sp. PCC 9605]